MTVLSMHALSLISYCCDLRGEAVFLICEVVREFVLIYLPHLHAHP